MSTVLYIAVIALAVFIVAREYWRLHGEAED